MSCHVLHYAVLCCAVLVRRLFVETGFKTHSPGGCFFGTRLEDWGLSRLFILTEATMLTIAL